MNNTSPEKHIEKNSNRLIGWLVSYSLDESGFSFRLTTGKTFIGTIQNPELKILSIPNDKTVSPLHLVLKATPDHKLFAEDIFSDYGSYLKRKDEAEQEITAPIEIFHGDWIRIGENIRFQVCLINEQSK